jgi:hypothetical protein
MPRPKAANLLVAALLLRFQKPPGIEFIQHPTQFIIMFGGGGLWRILLKLTFDVPVTPV